MASGVVGVDKCLQSLSVTDLEVAMESQGALKAVCSVRRFPISVLHDNGKSRGRDASTQQQQLKAQNFRSGSKRSRPQLLQEATRDGPRTGFIFETWISSKLDFDQV